MNSVGTECNELKKQYDACFNSWFADKFLKGKTQDGCASLFTVYKDCVRNAVRRQNIDIKEIDKDVLGSENEKTAPR